MDFQIIDENKFVNKNVLFIFPSVIVGGHELMTIEIIKSIIPVGCKVSIAYDRNLNHLEKVFSNMNLNIINIPFSSKKLEIIHAYLNIFLLNKAIHFFNNINGKFDEIIMVQGDIELGSIYAHAAKMINCRFTSYIPYTHTAKVRNKPLSSLRDLLSTPAYKWCDNFITIYNKAALDIVKYNSNANVSIIRNKVRNLDFFKLKIKNYERDNTKYKIFVIGRVYFSHKGHDRLLEVINSLDDNLIKKIELNIIGDGPDLEVFKIRVSEIKKLNIQYWGWMSEPWEEAYKADLIVIPSRYEGVPLVMLEALELNISILASNIDGMIDYVDKNNLFSDNTTFLKLLSNQIK